MLSPLIPPLPFIRTDIAPHYGYRVQVKGKVHPCTGTEALHRPGAAHRGSRGLALLFLDHGTRRGWGVSVIPRPLFTPRKDPVPVVQESVWAPGPVWTGAENLSSTGIRSANRPARSQSLYRLSYPVHIKCKYCTQINYLVCFTLTDSRYLILCVPSITILIIFIVFFSEAGTLIKFFNLLWLWWLYKILFVIYLNTFSKY